MRSLLKTLVLTTAVAALAAWGTPAFAFHDAGVAHCNGCHTMHNSEDGTYVDPDETGGNPWLLRDATPSDVCLSCHATRTGAVFGTDPLAPPLQLGAGNFVFLTEDNINDGHGGGDKDPVTGDWLNAIPGEAGGHSIVAPSKNVSWDSVLDTAPGGTFASTDLGCSSCHAPHGNGNFRMLNDAGFIQEDLYEFVSDAPVAVGLSVRDATGETPDNHTAYISGMSAWCGNCHNDFHNEFDGALIHPSGSTLGASIASAYGKYNGTDDPDNATHAATSYLPEVPFEDASAATDSTAGPVAASQVMCLTCHRAHASSAENAGRWDFDVTFLHEDGEESQSYALPDPYASMNQRSLCNKCHRKDMDSEPFVP